MSEEIGVKRIPPGVAGEELGGAAAIAAEKNAARSRRGARVRAATVAAEKEEKMPRGVYDRSKAKKRTKAAKPRGRHAGTEQPAAAATFNLGPHSIALSLEPGDVVCVRIGKAAS